MAEIHVLAAGFDSAAPEAASDALLRAFSAGHDLGDRTHHIRALGRTILALQQQLRQQLEQIRQKDLLQGLRHEAELLRLEAFACDIEALALIARNYETASADTNEPG